MYHIFRKITIYLLQTDVWNMELIFYEKKKSNIKEICSYKNFKGYTVGNSYIY